MEEEGSREGGKKQRAAHKIQINEAEIRRVEAIINNDVIRNPLIVPLLQIPVPVNEIPIVVASQDFATPSMKNKSEDNGN